ncbi:MAG: aldose epimerase family protein [Paracoccaceae bacterium]
MAQIARFGHSSDGREVQRITLAKGDLTIGLLTWGAVLHSVRLAGVAHDLTLGSDRMEDYQGAMHYHGPVIAPVANRIGGAEAMIGGRAVQFEANQAGHCLHSGSTGAHAQVWDVVSVTDDSATLGLSLPDGLGGFPGNRRVEARFSLTGRATLRLELVATTDAETLWNATSHGYWTLDGAETWAGHSLQIAAEHWLPTDANARPTGEIAPVAGGPMDFRTLRRPEPGSPALDHCFCLSNGPQPLRDVLILQGASGLRMTVATTEPGVQIYDGRDGKCPSRGPYAALAIETQGWSDAPSYPAFPPITLCPDAPARQITEWRFDRV